MPDVLSYGAHEVSAEQQGQTFEKYTLTEELMGSPCSALLKFAENVELVTKVSGQSRHLTIFLMSGQIMPLGNRG